MADDADKEHMWKEKYNFVYLDNNNKICNDYYGVAKTIYSSQG